MPVRAWPMRSVPIRATERVISWMAKGVVMPARSSASQISGMHAQFTEGGHEMVSLSKSRMSHAYAVSPLERPLAAMPTAHIQAATGRYVGGSVTTMLSLGCEHD